MVFWGFAAVTLPFVGLSVDSTPVLSAKAQILEGMFLMGVFLLFATSVIFTGGLDLIKPARPFQGWTLKQALVVLVGFFAVAVFQLFVNQAFFASTLAPYQSGSVVITPGPVTSTIIAVNAAIGEEALMGSATIGVWLTLVYVLKINRVVAAVLTLFAFVAPFFAWLHYYVLGTNPAGLVFVFGARIILSGVLLATLVFARRVDPVTHRKVLLAASLTAPYVEHTSWNLVTVGIP